MDWAILRRALEALVALHERKQRRALPGHPIDMRHYPALAALLLLSGCASNSITPVGSYTPHPLPASSTVYVYPSERDVPKSFTVVGLVSYTNPGKYQVLSLGDVIPALQKQARKIGANGLIIDETHAIKSGIISTGMGVTGRAIIVNP